MRVDENAIIPHVKIGVIFSSPSPFKTHYHGTKGISWIN
jgi:hypothetical protein